MVRGRVAERTKAPVLKTGGGVTRPWVRIPPLPLAGNRWHDDEHRDRGRCPVAKSKDKGSDKNTKRAATKTLKEKRAAKRAKRAGGSSS